MIKEKNAASEAMSCEILCSSEISMTKPIQDLFDECLNFISINSFEI